jgi:hypothetical protein
MPAFRTGCTTAVEDAATKSNVDPKMIVHLVDGTYELFRHFYRVKGFASRGLVGLI